MKLISQRRRLGKQC